MASDKPLNPDNVKPDIIFLREGEDMRVLLKRADDTYDIKYISKSSCESLVIFLKGVLSDSPVIETSIDAMSQINRCIYGQKSVLFPADINI
jgi:hypothetical protein